LLAELAARDIRLSLDGEKLRLNAPAAAMDDALKATVARRKAEIVASLRVRSRRQIPRRPESRPGSVPLSFAQRRLWSLDRMEPGAFSLTLATRLRGPLDRSALTGALDDLVERHESLRTCVRDQDGNPHGEMGIGTRATVRFVDLSGLDSAAREQEALTLGDGLVREPFDLAHGPMARCLLLRCSPNEHLVVVAIHRIAADAWSLGVAIRDIGVFYDARLAGKPLPLAPLPIQYADFAAWQRDRLDSGELAGQLSYWRRTLSGAPVSLELPTDRPRPPVRSRRGARCARRLSGELVAALETLSRTHGATLYMTLLGAWQLLLSRHSGQEDVLVGSPVANRDRHELEGVIGCLANTVVMRGRLAGNPRFSDFLVQVKDTVLGAYDHRELPFERLVEALRPERSTSHTPVFQVWFSLQSVPAGAPQLSCLDVEVVETGTFEPPVSLFDLALDMEEHGGALRMSYTYATDLFDEATIARAHEQYVTILRHIAADADRTVLDIPLLSDEDHRLMGAVNETASARDRSRCVHDLVQAAAERSRDAIAVEACDRTLTYTSLERRANQLAHLLRVAGSPTGHWWASVSNVRRRCRSRCSGC
jgi:hypothetical protein